MTSFHYISICEKSEYALWREFHSKYQQKALSLSCHLQKLCCCWKHLIKQHSVICILWAQRFSTNAINFKMHPIYGDNYFSRQKINVVNEEWPDCHVVSIVSCGLTRTNQTFKQMWMIRQKCNVSIWYWNVLLELNHFCNSECSVKKLWKISSLVGKILQWLAVF